VKPTRSATSRIWPPPRVFETYKSGWESFPEGAFKPLPWDDRSIAPACKSLTPPRSTPLPPNSLVLAALSKFDTVVKQPGNEDGNRLMAQNGSLVRYLAAFNQEAYTLLQLHNAGKPAKAADGSITVKSAWIEIIDSKPDPKKFYHRLAWVQNLKDGSCREATVALVGLHIVHKTKTNPQWIWASFEHVDNVPLHVKPPVLHDPALQRYTFNKGDGRAMEPPLPPNPTEPYNVERVFDLAKPLKDVNKAWRDKLSSGKKPSVWSNYELVVVQWGLGPGADPAPPCAVGENDTNMTNSTMETALQSPQACPGKVENTCFGCHALAPGSDFIWAIPLHANPSPPNGVPAGRPAALSILTNVMGASAR
jgi:hypothetical protein